MTSENQPQPEPSPPPPPPDPLEWAATWTQRHPDWDGTNDETLTT